MPRESHDREDLLAEATALVERMSLQVVGHDEAVVVGFRRDRSASYYFGHDPVYQFNSAGKLRRAFVEDLVYKAVAGKLVAMRRESTATAVQLASRELGSAESSEFLRAMQQRLHHLAEKLASGQFTCLGQVPAGADLVGRIRESLEVAPGPKSLHPRDPANL